MKLRRRELKAFDAAEKRLSDEDNMEVAGV